eukprot:5787555-Pleurochrysis_carterae.AAC.1
MQPSKAPRGALPAPCLVHLLRQRCAATLLQTDTLLASPGRSLRSRGRLPQRKELKAKLTTLGSYHGHICPSPLGMTIS